MKQKLTLRKSLLVLGILLGISTGAFAAGTSLKWATYGAPLPQVFYDSNFSYCGATPTKNLEVHFGCNTCGSSTCPIKRYEYTIVLYKDGVAIDSKVTNAQAGSVTVYWNTFSMGAGVYRAGVSSRIKDFGCLSYHTLENNVMSNSIVVTATNGNPLFTINGITPLPNYTPIVVPPGCITMNAQGTTCETNYFLGVSESDFYLARTYQYEWGLWFSGEAPNGMNLQNLSTTYSYLAYGYVGDPARQGSPMIGGNLSATYGGGPRYYRVSLCVGPVWTCTTALVRIDNNLSCRPGADSEDTNVYTVVSSSEAATSGEQVVTSFSELLAIKQQKQMVVSPNPGNGLFTISFANTEKAQVEVYDMKGSKVASAEFDASTYQFDLSAYPKGVYMVSIIAGSDHFTKKIILE